MKLQSLLLATLLASSGTALGRGVAHGAEFLAFSSDGTRALCVDTVHDMREGGRSVTYRVIGRGAVEVVPDNNISYGAGPHQHVAPAECRAALKVLGAALSGFRQVTLHPEGCDQTLRTLLVATSQGGAGDGAFAAQGNTLGRGDFTLASDGEKVKLARCGKTVATFAVKIPAEALAANLSPSGKLLLLFFRGDDETRLAAIAESPSGKPEELALQRGN